MIKCHNSPRSNLLSLQSDFLRWRSEEPYVVIYICQFPLREHKIGGIKNAAIFTQIVDFDNEKFMKDLLWMPNVHSFVRNKTFQVQKNFVSRKRNFCICMHIFRRIVQNKKTKSELESRLVTYLKVNVLHFYSV